MQKFRTHVTNLWRRALRRRSQKDDTDGKQTGSRMATKGSGSSSMACGAVHRQTPEAGARCVNRARRDLCGVSGNGYPYRDLIGEQIMGFPSPATDYIESTLTVNSLCNITANSRVIPTDRGYVVLGLSLKVKQEYSAHTFCWRTSVCKANG